MSIGSVLFLLILFKLCISIGFYNCFVSYREIANISNYTCGLMCSSSSVNFALYILGLYSSGHSNFNLFYLSGILNHNEVNFIVTDSPCLTVCLRVWLFLSFHCSPPGILLSAFLWIRKSHKQHRFGFYYFNPSDNQIIFRPFTWYNYWHFELKPYWGFLFVLLFMLFLSLCFLSDWLFSIIQVFSTLL